MPFLILIAVLAALWLFLIFPGQSSEEARSPFYHRNFAHRGLYNNDRGVPENSLAAFRAAMENGYGCELDVQFTKDKQLIVFHDNDYKRACGVDRPVWELTLEEARQLSLFGTDERIPTFREVLDTVAGRNPLIVEIKAEELNAQWYEELTEAAVKELSSYEGQWCLESFNPIVVRWAWKNIPSTVRGLLVGGIPSKNEEKYRTLLTMIAHMLLNFYCRPQFIAFNHRRRTEELKLVKKLGAFSVMWTVDTPEDQEKLENEEDVIIFERYLPSTHYRKNT